MTGFDGQVAVVTGAASGIGEATARLFARRGARVAVTDINEAGAERVASQIVDHGGTAFPLRCDAGSRDDWRRLADAVLDRYGRVDIVHNNAFTLTIAPAHEQGEREWDRQLGVNLTSVYLSVRTFIDQLRAHRGCIVNTSSVHALLGFRGHPAYAAAKGGMVSLTRQLAVEYGPDVRVNAVLPGPVRTPNWDGVAEEYIDLTTRSTPAGRMGHPDEVATAVCFLASSDASFVSGATLLVDGGFTAQKDPL